MLPPAFWRAVGDDLAIYFLLLLPPAVLSGAAFPLAVRLWSRIRRRPGPESGAIAAINTLGGIVGSLAIGFLVLPALGLEWSVKLLHRREPGFRDSPPGSLPRPALAGSGSRSIAAAASLLRGSRFRSSRRHPHARRLPRRRRGAARLTGGAPVQSRRGAPRACGSSRSTGCGRARTARPIRSWPRTCRCCSTPLRAACWWWARGRDRPRAASDVRSSASTASTSSPRSST